MNLRVPVHVATLAILVGVAPLFADEAPIRFTLGRCVAIAIEHSPALRSAIERQASADAEADQAGAARWPIVVLNANGRYISEVNEIDLPTLPPRAIRFGDHDTYDVAAGVRMPLYTGGSVSAAARARRAAADAGDHDVAAARLRLIRDVRHAFLAALGADETVRAAALAVDRLRRHVDDLSERIDLGAATDEVRLETEARLRIAEQRLVEVEEHRTVARLRLGALLGRPAEAVAPEGTLDEPVADSTSLSDTAGASVDARPELHALEEEERASSELRRAAAGRFLPSVDAVAEIHYGRPGPRLTENEWMEWTAVGVELTWTLWDAGSRAAAVRARTADARALAEMKTNVRESLESALAVARERVIAGHARIELAEDRVRLETRRLVLVDGRAREGWGTESERLDVRDDLTEAEIALAVARADLRIAEAELLYAVGR